ncbi:FAD-dependent oxidoreductase [Mycolicibacterium mengxianglii]|uniref:FAD-dependent oxidoreductase n=1 Tax=Mycolicibacterium mengxianglii TaxID=2736649 RepID=UPI0018EF271B|nr:FAD-dependent oxidoreductase [Mycolicibacterium mengxianglii]
MEPSRNPVIIGAGPAGLTAALDLVRRGVTPRLYEATGAVGGLASTPTQGDWRVDPGGHRFFTRSEEILQLWDSLLPPDQWLTVRRDSAMLVDGHYVRYPLVGRDLLTQLGIRRGLYGLSSLLRSRARGGSRGADHSASFREWGVREFGRYWYNLFFDGYVRKTWLADPGNLTSDWADQRIKPIGWHVRSDPPSAAQDSFRYPRLGPGQLWDAAAVALSDAGVIPALNSQVTRVRSDGRSWILDLQNGESASADAVFSSMPLRLLVETLEPHPPAHIRAVAAALKHRALITVAVALPKRYDIPYHWVYTPGERFHSGRIQNYGRWSAELAPPDWKGTYLGLEYFTLPDEELWLADDERLAAIVEQDLRALGLSPEVEHIMCVRSRYAYPISDPARDKSVALIRDWLRTHHPTLHPIGRNGMHRYDNQDHAMLSALHSVAHYFGEDVDPWQVNTDRGFHEYGLLKR